MRLANVGLVIAALLFSLLIIEVGLRVFGISYQKFDYLDPTLGLVWKPGSEGLFIKEGTSHVRINSDGLVDREHDIKKPPDTFRIAVLGDSMAAALAVERSVTFSSEMERDLAQCKKLQDKKVEVINFGVSGFGTAQELLTLETKVWKYQPDIVLLAFFVGNDIRNNSKELKEGRRPYFIMDNNGDLHLDNSFIDEPGAKFRNSPLGHFMDELEAHSRIIQLILEFRRRMTAVRAPTPLWANPEAGLDREVYKPPADATWSRAWAITEELIRRIAKNVRDNGAKFLLTSLSTSIQANPNADIRSKFEQSLGVNDLLYPDLRIEVLAERENYQFVMLAPQMLEWSEANKTCVHGFPNATPCAGHWNENGHRLAGQLLAEKICKDML